MLKKIIITIAILLVITVSVAAYSVFRTPEAATGPIQAIPLNTETSASAETTAPTTAAVPTVTPAAPKPTAAPTEAATPSPEAEAPAQVSADSPLTPPAQAGDAGATQPAEVAVSQASPASPLTFEIIPAQSEARFLIDEVLQGDPVTVKGVTNQVAGQFALNPPIYRPPKWALSR